VKAVRRLTAVLATFAIVALSAGPAHADELPTGCRDSEGHNHEFSGWAYYTTDGAYHSWYEFRYLIWNNATGGKSNVDITVNENFTVNYRYRSPDDRKHDVLYTLRPPVPVTTRVQFPEFTEFYVVFDERNSGDPHCTAGTDYI